MPGLADVSMHSYRLWADATRYLVHRSGLIDAAVASGPEAEADATFAEVPASPGD